MKNTINRRQLLVWTAPVVATVTLPAHAATSVCLSAEPVVNLVVDPKCAGNPPIGQSTFSIGTSIAGCALTIESITVISSNPADTVTPLTPLPAVVDASSMLEFNYEGPASDGITCLPLSDVSVSIAYSCEGGPTLTIMADLTTLILNDSSSQV